MRMDCDRNGVTTLTLIWTILDVWNEERCCCAAEAVARPTWLSRLNLVAKFCAASRIDECIWRGGRAEVRKSREEVGGIIGKKHTNRHRGTRTTPFEEQTECRRQRKAVNNANKKQSVSCWCACNDDSLGKRQADRRMRLVNTCGTVERRWFERLR